MERLVDDNFYAYSRGRILVCLTNTNETVTRTIKSFPFPNGEYIFNIFNVTENFMVRNGIEVTLRKGEVKIFTDTSPVNSANPNSHKIKRKMELFIE